MRRIEDRALDIAAKHAFELGERLAVAEGLIERLIPWVEAYIGISGPGEAGQNLVRAAKAFIKKSEKGDV